MRPLAYLLTSAIMIGASGAAHVSAQTSESSVWITRIDPPISVTLVPGTTVHFSVDAQYTLTSAEGRVVLFIQGAETQFGRIANDEKPIIKGSGIVSFTVDAKIPPTRHVAVTTALYTGYGESTSITDHRVFEVVRAPYK